MINIEQVIFISGLIIGIPIGAFLFNFIQHLRMVNDLKLKKALSTNILGVLDSLPNYPLKPEQKKAIADSINRGIERSRKYERMTFRERKFEEND